MRVLLVETTSESYRKNACSHLARVLEPLAIEYNAAHLEAKGHEVELIQQLTQSNEEILDIIVKSRPDIVGFSCMTYSYPDTVALATAVKRELPQVHTILGGYHVIGMEESPECFDFVIKGEGEVATERIIDFIRGKKDLQYIPGLLFYQTQRWEIPPSKVNLARLEFPKRLPRETYYSLSMGENLPNTRIACVVAGRGCPYRCDFCCTPQLFPGKRTYRPPHQVVDEIIKLRDEHGVNNINLRDETFTSDKRYVREFCEVMIQHEANVSWRAFANIGNVDRELLKLMADAGCHMLFFGIEASDPVTLKTRRKNFKNIGRVYEDINTAQEFGIFVRGGFIVGHESDSREAFKRHEVFLREVCPDELIISFLTPFPGTPLYQQAKRDGKLLTDDLRKYDCEHPVLDIGIPSEELVELRNDLYCNFYASPEWTTHVVSRAQNCPGERETIERFVAFETGRYGVPNPFDHEVMECAVHEN